MPGVGQPDAAPFMKFNFNDVQAIEVGTTLAPTTVITNGTDFQLRVRLGFEGLLAPLLVGQNFQVAVHAQNLETGDIKTLNVGVFPVPGGASLADFEVASPNFTTGTAGSGADLVIPAGFAAGTYRMLTHVHFENPVIRPIVAGFHDGLIIMVS